MLAAGRLGNMTTSDDTRDFSTSTPKKKNKTFLLKILVTVCISYLYKMM